MRSTNMSNYSFARAAIAGVLGLVGMSLGCDKSPSGPTSSPALTVPAQPNTPTSYVLYGVTLFGVVSEETSGGQTPIGGVRIYCDACGEFGHTDSLTDANGYYSFTGDLAHGGGIWLAPGYTTPLLV